MLIHVALVKLWHEGGEEIAKGGEAGEQRLLCLAQEPDREERVVDVPQHARDLRGAHGATLSVGAGAGVTGQAGAV